MRRFLKEYALTTLAVTGALVAIAGVAAAFLLGVSLLHDGHPIGVVAIIGSVLLLTLFITVMNERLSK